MTTMDRLTQEPAPKIRIGWGEAMTYRALGKRVLDLALAVPALILGAPLFALLALCVRIKLGRPVLFRQERPGLRGKLFTLVKFRTMTQECDQAGNLLPDKDRLTRFGRLLRSTSLDELPELLNVLRGEMSLVGPRPLLPRYMPYFSKRESTRFEVLPGITGMAQINGRNESPWEERFAGDVWYVENQSLALDLKIIAHTLLKVVRRQGVQAVPESTVIALDKERQGELTASVSGAS